MKKFCISYAIRGYFDVNVEAVNIVEAREKADAIVYSTEFHNLIDPESEIVDDYEVEY